MGKPSLLLLAAAPSLLLAAAASVGEAVHVADGDTLTVQVQGRRIEVRLAGIDAPELGQPFGTRAKRALAALVFGKQVRVLPVEAGRRPAGQVVFAYGDVKVERGVIHARVFIDGREVNAELVRGGHAWVAPAGRADRTLNELESAARAARRGLWAADAHIPPWAWRRGQRTLEHRRTVCTQEVRKCPGGTWVSRRPPGCGFAPCPGKVRRQR